MTKDQIKQGLTDLVTSANNYWAICAKTRNMSLMVSQISLETLNQLEIKFEHINSECTIPGFPHEVTLTVEQYDILADKSDDYSN